MRLLDAVSLPANIVALRFPDIPMASDYPTLGPTGVSRMNVNGLAASLELYLQEDVLLTDGQLIPVQWRGFNDMVKQYQGVVVDKKAAQDRFLEKPRECEADLAVIEKGAWRGMRAIIRHAQGIPG